MKESKWNSKGGGMRKHRVSGVAHNHAYSISRVREYNAEQEKLRKLKKKQEPPLYNSVQDVFRNI